MKPKDRERFNNVYREVENCYHSKAKGCMYTAISNLSPDNYEDICKYFQIREDSSINEDLQFFDEDLRFFQENYIDNDQNNWSNAMNSLREQWIYFLRNSSPWQLKIILIIFISLIVIGSYVFIKSVILEPKDEPNITTGKGGNGFKGDIGTRETPPRQNSILCLVVPSNQLNGVNPSEQLPSSHVKELISSASYFRCISPEPFLEVKLNVSSSKDIDYVSDEDAYIEFLIPEGSEMIANDTKFSLRKNVPDNIYAEIRKIGRLNSFDGLEKFICA